MDTSAGLRVADAGLAILRRAHAIVTHRYSAVAREAAVPGDWPRIADARTLQPLAMLSHVAPHGSRTPGTRA